MMMSKLLSWMNVFFLENRQNYLITKGDFVKASQLTYILIYKNTYCKLFPLWQVGAGGEPILRLTVFFSPRNYFIIISGTAWIYLSSLLSGRTSFYVAMWTRNGKKLYAKSEWPNETAPSNSSQVYLSR